METLRKQIKRQSFVHTLVKRTKHVAMYTVEMENEIIGYEVFIIREQRERTMTIAGKEIQLKEKELFPRDEDFGYTAYAPSSRERADEYFKKLSQRVEMKRRGISLN